MEERARIARDRRAFSAFIERFAAVLTASGFPPMPARVFAALLASELGIMTSAELCGLLKASPAAISGAVRYLGQVNLVSREREPGLRRERYRVHSDAWCEAMAGQDRVLARCEQSLREGLELLGRRTRAGARLAETLAFFEFLQAELPAMLERWRARRSRSRFGFPDSPRLGRSRRRLDGAP